MIDIAKRIASKQAMKEELAVIELFSVAGIEIDQDRIKDVAYLKACMEELYVRGYKIVKEQRDIKPCNGFPYGQHTMVLYKDKVIATRVI